MKDVLDQIKKLAEFQINSMMNESLKWFLNQPSCGNTCTQGFEAGAKWQHAKDAKIILAQNKVIEKLVSAFKYNCRCGSGDPDYICKGCIALSKTEALLKKILEEE